MSNKKFKSDKKQDKTPQPPVKPGKTTIKQANPFAGQGKTWFFTVLCMGIIAVLMKMIGEILAIMENDTYLIFAMISGVCTVMFPGICIMIEVFAIRDCLFDMQYGGEGKYFIPLTIEFIITVAWLVYAIVIMASIMKVAVG